MIVSFSKQDLINAVKPLLNITSPKSPFAYASLLNFSVTPTQTTISCFNGRDGAYVYIPSNSDSSFSFAVNALRFASLIDSLPDEIISLQLSENTIKISSQISKVKASIFFLSNINIPSPNKTTPTWSFSVNTNDLSKLIHYGSISSFGNPTSHLHDVLFLSLNNNTASFFSTDNKCLSFFSATTTQNNILSASIPLPAKFFRNIKTAIESSSNIESVSCFLVESTFFTSFANFTFYTQPFSLKIPDASIYFSETKTKTASVSAHAIRNAFTQAIIACDDELKVVSISFSDNTLSIYANSSSFGEISIDVPCEYSGPTTTFNVAYSLINDFIRAIKDDTISFHFNHETDRAITCTISSEPDFKYLFVPIAKKD